jgi:hypothetical protein
MSKTIVIMILAFALLGVSSVQAGMGTKVTLRYDPFEVRGMARPGIPTVILGQAADGADAGAVRALLHVPSWLGSTTFVDAGPSTSGHRLVFILNPSDPVAAKRDVCGQVGGLGLAQPGPRLTIRAAYCIGDKMVSRVTAVERPVSGPDDPRLRKLLRRIVDGLLPRTSRAQYNPPGL